MRILLKRLLELTIFGIVISPSFAVNPDPTFRFANGFNDDMVLQQEKPIRIFGWASPGAGVEVTITRDAELA